MMLLLSSCIVLPGYENPQQVSPCKEINYKQNKYNNLKKKKLKHHSIDIGIYKIRINSLIVVRVSEQKVGINSAKKKGPLDSFNVRIIRKRGFTKPCIIKLFD